MKVLFYRTPMGRSPVEEFILEQNKQIRSDIFDAISLLESGKALQMPLSRPLPGIHKGLNELRFKGKVGQIRIVYYIKKAEAIYMIHAFKKKTRTLPKSDKALVVKRLREI